MTSPLTEAISAIQLLSQALLEAVVTGRVDLNALAKRERDTRAEVGVRREEDKEAKQCGR